MFAIGRALQIHTVSTLLGTLPKEAAVNNSPYVNNPLITHMSHLFHFPAQFRSLTFSHCASC